MQQTSFSDIEYDNRRKKTRKEVFLDQMDRLIPWEGWLDLIRPCYPEGKRGRPPKDLELMLRMYLVQNWFRLSAEATEDAVYDSYAMRKFLHLDFTSQQVPSATTLLKFRHLMQEKAFDKILEQDLTAILREAGMTLRRGRTENPSIRRSDNTMSSGQ